jgi:hypothetical protein
MSRLHGEWKAGVMTEHCFLFWQGGATMEVSAMRKMVLFIDLPTVPKAGQE